MRKILEIASIGSVLISCGQTMTPLRQGSALTSEGRESLNSTSVEEQEIVVTSSPQSGVPNNATTYNRENTDIASEPIAVAGAYLSCRYRDGLEQYASEWSLQCAITGLPTIDPLSIQARFEKQDASNSTTNLTVAAFDAAQLTWTLRETKASFSSSTVRAIIEIPGLSALELSTQVEASVVLSLNPAFWISGEPNNNNRIENCAEFITADRKTRFPSAIIAASGPTARYNDIPCGNSVPFLCRKSADQSGANWIVSDSSAPYAEGERACPSGYKFRMPLDEGEHLEVIAFLDSIPGLDSVWVPLDDQAKEGDFRLYQP